MSKNKTELLLILLISILTILYYARFIPFQMDEFVAFHTISCHHYSVDPANIFRSMACQGSDLTLPGGHTYPLRTYKFIGSLASLLYYPVFLAWPSPHSVRVIGLLYLIAQAFLLSRIFSMGMLNCFLLLLLFVPYSFQHIVDTGPVRFQITTVFLLLYLTRCWCLALERESRSSWLYSVLIGLLLFLGVWEKITYFFILPGLAGMIAYEVMLRRGILARVSARARFFRQSVTALGVFIFPTFMLLSAKRPSGNPYADYIFEAPRFGMLETEDWARHFVQAIWPYFADPLMTAHRIHETAGRFSWLGLLLWGALLAAAVYGLYKARRDSRVFRFSVVHLSLFVLTLFVLSLSPMTWAMHHVVLSFPFLLLAVVNLINAKADRIVAGLVALLIFANGYMLFQLPHQPMKAETHRNVVRLNDLLNEAFAEDVIFVVFNYGPYYWKALYGDKDQEVVSLGPGDYVPPGEFHAQLLMLKRLLHEKNKRAVFLGRKDDDNAINLRLLNSVFPGLKQMEIDFDVGGWIVLYEGGAP